MKKKILVSLLSAAVLVTGCNKILDQKPLMGLLPNAAIGNADNAESLLNSAYASLRAGKLYGEALYSMAEIPSDNTSTVNSALLMMENFTWNPSSGYINGPYEQAYNCIAQSNFLIELIDGADMEEERKEQIKGEAKFLRGLSYFLLVRLYGGVPLYTRPVLSGDQQTIQENAQAPRASVDDVYTQILKDLEEASVVVPVTQADAGKNRFKAIRSTVHALLSKVYLYRGEWQKAIDAAETAIANPLYTLLPDFEALWPAEGKAESIFELDYNPPVEGGNVLPDEVLPFPLANWSWDKFPRPTPEFIENVADRTNDKRYKLMGPIMYGGVHIANNHSSFLEGLPNTYPGGGGPADLGYFIYKYRNIGTLSFNNPDNIGILRLADIKLILAEAENELNGPGNALAPLNEIRIRAGLAALEASALPTKQACRNEIDRQRRLELAFEGERWFDLVRYAHLEMEKNIEHEINALDIIQGKRGNADRNYLLYPIPQGEINSNPNVQQNPGY